MSEAPRGYVDPAETIGDPSDASATSVSDENSMFSLAKGMARELGLSSDDGNNAVNTSPRLFNDPLATLGDMDDAAATGSAAQRWSAISLLKGILAQAGI